MLLIFKLQQIIRELYDIISLYDHLALIPVPDGEDLTVQLQPPVLDELTPEVEYADGALAKYDQVRVQQYQTL